jgi:hypothetical protein
MGIDSEAVIRASQCGISRIAFESMRFKFAGESGLASEKKIKKRLTRIARVRAALCEGQTPTSSRKLLFFNVYLCSLREGEPVGTSTKNDQ